MNRPLRPVSVRPPEAASLEADLAASGFNHAIRWVPPPLRNRVVSYVAERRSLGLTWREIGVEIGVKADALSWAIAKWEDAAEKACGAMCVRLPTKWPARRRPPAYTVTSVAEIKQSHAHLLQLSRRQQVVKTVP